MLRFITMNNLHILMFLEGVIIIIGLYLAFFKSYFQEKGKNVATSEDIENITRKVENVKKEIAEDFALSKSKIDILYNIELKQISNEKEALINFHRTFSLWFNKLTSSLNLLDDSNNSEISSKIKEYNEVYQKVLDEYSILEIYCENQEFLTLISNLKIKILQELSKNHPQTLLRIKYNNDKYCIIENYPESAKKYEEFGKLRDEKMEIIDEFHIGNIDGLKKTIDDYKKYIEVLKKELKK